jgi:hypothetical protein
MTTRAAAAVVSTSARGISSLGILREDGVLSLHSARNFDGVSGVIHMAAYFGCRLGVIATCTVEIEDLTHVTAYMQSVRCHICRSFVSTAGALANGGVSTR